MKPYQVISKGIVQSPAGATKISCGYVVQIGGNTCGKKHGFPTMPQQLRSARHENPSVRWLTAGTSSERPIAVFPYGACRSRGDCDFDMAMRNSNQRATESSKGGKQHRKRSIYHLTYRCCLSSVLDCSYVDLCHVYMETHPKSHLPCINDPPFAPPNPHSLFYHRASGCVVMAFARGLEGHFAWRITVCPYHLPMVPDSVCGPLSPPLPLLSQSQTTSRLHSAPIHYSFAHLEAIWPSIFFYSHL